MFLLRKSFGFSRPRFKRLRPLRWMDVSIHFDPDDVAPCIEAMLTHDLGEQRGSNVYCSTDEDSA